MNISKTFNISNMNELKWDKTLEAEADKLAKSCKYKQHNDNYRVYIFGMYLQDPTRHLVDQGNFVEAVNLVNKLGFPFCNLVEMVVPKQEKIACFNAPHCNTHPNTKVNEICLLGP
uniref:Uncharacterized protein n=2 Tax=Caenorhabditis japonica TaxID=281687 RepID=A0A8R1IFL3_CAEJA